MYRICNFDVWWKWAIKTIQVFSVQELLSNIKERLTGQCFKIEMDKYGVVLALQSNDVEEIEKGIFFFL